MTIRLSIKAEARLRGEANRAHKRDMDAKVRAFYEQGINTPAAIAKELGGGISRNAVRGRMHRMGLYCRPRQVDIAADLDSADVPIAPPKLVKPVPTQINRLKPSRYTPPLTGPSPTCQWIIQEGPRPRDAIMCGKESVSEQSWCAEHLLRVASGYRYIRPSRRKDPQEPNQDQEEWKASSMLSPCSD